MGKKERAKKKKLQLTIREDIYRALRIRAGEEMKSVTRLVTEWVESWKEFKK